MSNAVEIARLEGMIAALTERSANVNDADELRSILANITTYRSKIDELRNAEPEERQLPPADAQPINAQVVATYRSATDVVAETDENPYNSREYRQAFMDYVQRGVAIPARLVQRVETYRQSLGEEQRAGIPITTANTGAAIPFTVINEVINTVRKRYGNLYRKVRKLALPGGVAYPVAALEGTMRWIKESTVSPRQAIGDVEDVTFNYHTAEIRVAQSFLSWVLTIEDFESKIAEVIVTAYLKAMDYAIVRGTGKGMPLGIINDSRVTNVISMTAAQINNWKAWRKDFFAKLPLGYRGGEFIFPVSTADAYLETMSDANNNPIFRQATGLEINDGDAQNPNGRFFGRDISLVEPDIITDFDTASANDIIGIYWQPEEYGVNENFAFRMERYFDQETNEWVDKAIIVVDGKVLNPNGIWLIKKA